MLATIAAEREAVTLRVADPRLQSESIHAVAELVDRDLASAERLPRQMDEVLGLAPQLAIENLGGEIRGQRLREVAVEVLRQRRGACLPPNELADGPIATSKAGAQARTVARLRPARRRPACRRLLLLERFEDRGRAG
jgi:hypothetical protein